MAQTFSDDVVVLRKIKLGESDIIYDLLSQDGSMLKAVGKGARKPGSSMASRLEMFNVSHVLASKGRSLDILKEARVDQRFPKLQEDPEYLSAASCIAEVALKAIQPDIEIPRLFDMTCACFSALSDAAPSNNPLMVAAYILKVSSLTGMRPSIRACAACASPLELEDSSSIRFSYPDGGAICDACASFSDTVSMSAPLARWVDFALMSRFDDLKSCAIGNALSWDVLNVAHQWEMVHFGSRIKSIASLASFSLT